MSSRNKNLKIDEQKAALNVVKALRKLKDDIIQFKRTHSKTVLERTDLVSLKHLAVKNIVENPLIKLDYFEIIESENFRFTDYIDYNKNYRALIAVYIGEIRLIDNISIN